MSISDYLSQVPLFQGLSACERVKLAESMRRHTYSPSDVIVRQGDRTTDFYIILSGSVRVSRKAGRREIPIADLHAGDFFGDMALLDSLPRSATVTAIEPTECLSLSWESFHRDVLSKPEVARAMLSTLSRRVRDIEDLAFQPQTQSPASPREREDRLLREGESSLISDIRETLTIKSGNLFLLCDEEGNIPIGNTAGLGLYLGDTRHLSAYEMILDQIRPTTLLTSARLGSASEQQLTNRDIRIRNRIVRKETLLISRSRIIGSGLEERLVVSNFNSFEVTITLLLRFSSDFADIFEVRGLRRDQRGSIHRPTVDPVGVTLSYDGLDHVRRETRLEFSPAPDRVSGTSAVFRLRLPPLGSVSLRITVTASHSSLHPATRDHSRVLMPAHGQGANWLAAQTNIETNNEFFNAALDRSLADLRLLINRLDDDEYIAAGTPWYASLFGRDSLITAWQTLAWNPEIARGVLRLLARFQGRQRDDWRDEEPGKILHELRTGELAKSGLIPHSPYYGAVDSTPLFVMLLGAYERWTGDHALVEQLAPALDAALQWMIQDGDPDHDGFIEYSRRSIKGLANQGWKDSGEGIVNRNGSLPQPPIALVEVQGYAYAAYLAGADLLETLGRTGEAGNLRARAVSLRDRFEQQFWMETERYYALGLDGRKQHITAITSNPGHALWTGIASQERAELVADRLLSPALFSGWGVRTLAEDMAAYNPLGYHLGTIWPHDNALIVAGLMRYGFPDHARRIATSLFDAGRAFRYYRLPELFCGITRTEHSTPIGYPVACSPQAWAAGSLPYILQALLGIHPQSSGRVLLVDHPALPDWLREVRVNRLRIGSGRVNLVARREGPRTAVDVLAVDGDVAVDVRLGG